MPTLDGEVEEEQPSLPERVRVTSQRVLGADSVVTVRTIVFFAGIVIALSMTSAPWLQIGLLSAGGLLLEMSRRGKLRP